MLPRHLETTIPAKRLKWDFENVEKRDMFYRRVTQILPTILSRLPCHGSVCHDEHHKNLLDDIWGNFLHVVTTEAKRIFGTKTCRDRIVPGWNALVREHYAASREAFLAWRRDNSPRQGTSADHMRRCRARFKLALRQCKAVEQEARALAVAQNFMIKA